MAYTINYTDITNKGSIVIEDNTVNTTTTLSIPEDLLQTMVHLLDKTFYSY